MSEATEDEVSTAVAATGIEKLSLSGSQQTDEGDMLLCTAGTDAAYTYDPDLFQPPPPPADCLLCCLPLIFEGQGCTYLTCCGNSICTLCLLKYVRAKNEKNEQRASLKEPALPRRCPFCRALSKVPEKEERERLQKRMDANDPDAYDKLGGNLTNAGDLKKGLELTLKSAALGFTGAYSNAAKILSVQSTLLRMKGDASGAEQISSSRRKYLEIGAKEGDIVCHHYLGELESESGRPILAYKHFCFATQHGHTESSKQLLQGFSEGHIRKDEYAAALRAYKVANDAMMSFERHIALKVSWEYNDLHVLEKTKEAILSANT